MTEIIYTHSRMTSDNATVKFIILYIHKISFFPRDMWEKCNNVYNRNKKSWCRRITTTVSLFENQPRDKSYKALTEKQYDLIRIVGIRGVYYFANLYA